MMEVETVPKKFSEILCIGLGLSGVCLGVQLKRKFGFTDIHFYDRNASYSGTWWSNRYPGCACDIPAILYSFSFELNPNWTRLLPSDDEIREYLEHVVQKYQLRPCMTFRTECESAHWDSERHVWNVNLRDLATGTRYIHECRLLFSAVGVLVDPKDPNIPGADTFTGPMFHTARWRSDVELKDKDVIVIGNGCSATQTVPEIASTTKTLTQFINTPHWLVERANTEFGPGLQWSFRNIPMFARLVRLIIFLAGENNWRMFILNKSGARMRRAGEKESTEYILRSAPEKYHDILIPDWEFACKRRVFTDGKYLKALHAPNLHLTKDPILEILPLGVRTATKTYPADVIVLATGFQTNNGLGPLRIQGRDGEWLEDHWKKAGGPGAYNNTAVHGYPNFLMLYGPNSSTGHTSVLLAIENMVNYSLKIIEPVIRGDVSEIEVKEEAERTYLQRLQEASSNKIWNTCRNWYVTNGWNSTMYPWSQFYFLWRSTFPTWHDWEYKYTSSRTRPLGTSTVLLMLSLTVIGAVLSLSTSLSWTPFLDSASELVQKWKKQISV